MNSPAIISARHLTKLIFCLFGICAVACRVFGTDSDNMSLSPNAYIQLEFPQLPETFFVKKTSAKIPTQLTARLPSNYSADKKFPLFVFLAGGDGGKADKDAIGSPYVIIGDADYIRVTLPLFKKNLDPQTDIQNDLAKDLPPGTPAAIVEGLKKMATNGIVMGGDYEAISSAYSVMLKKLYETIPNIDLQRSVLAGFSNGAHTIGVLLEKKDPFILEHFHSFCMAEGGMEMMMNPKTLADELKNHRFLVLVGDGANEKESATAPRPIILQVVKSYVQLAKAGGFDFSLEVMQNTGHSLNPQYYPLIRQWAFGGSVTAQPNSTVQTPSATPTASSTPQTAPYISSALPPGVQNALQMPEGDARMNAVRTAALEWEQKQPTAALEWVCSLPNGELRNRVLKATAEDWGKRDPLPALDWVMKREIKPNAPEMGAVHFFVTEWAKKDWNAAAAWADKQPKGGVRTTAFYSVADGWAQKDALAAAAWVQKIKDAGDRRVAESFVIRIWGGQKKLEETAAWIQQLPPEDIKDAAPKLASIWAKTDATKADAWVNKLPLSEADKAEILKKNK